MVHKIICLKPKADIEADIIVLTEYVIAQRIDYLFDNFDTVGAENLSVHGILIAKCDIK